MVVDPAGPDGIVGTLDDDYRLRFESPAIDAGDTMALPLDAWDLDDDGIVGERWPLDFDGNERAVDHPWVADTGVPGLDGAVVDLGPWEFAAPPCPEDLVPPLGVGQLDLIAVLNRWGDPACQWFGSDYPCREDLDDQRGVGMGDVNAVLDRWGDPACE